MDSHSKGQQRVTGRWVCPQKKEQNYKKVSKIMATHSTSILPLEDWRKFTATLMS